jgi:hypothetical protein
VKDDDWLEEIPRELDRIASALEEDLIKPTQSLISLLYQSVSIRDSRLSLQIDTSMWRLSWITFIFLPLTFMVGFFGMNVDTFSRDPSIKWYFIVSIPFMLFVVGGWYITKHILARQRQTPYQRGIYESFFHDLAVSYPSLWSRVGPRDYIVPRTRLDKWKWWLIKRWSRPERTIKAGQSNAETAAPDDLSGWSKCKRYLIRKWTNDIITFKTESDPEFLDVDEETDLEQGSVLVDGLIGATELLTVPGQPVVSAVVEKLEEAKVDEHHQHHPHDDEQRKILQPPSSRPPQPIEVIVYADQDSPPVQTPASESSVHLFSQSLRIGSPFTPPSGRRATSSNSPRGRRPTSAGDSSVGSRNSSLLVEEEDPNWINQLAREGRGWYWRAGSQSPGPRAGDGRRTSSGSGSRPPASGLRRGIDEQVGGRDPSSSSGDAAATPTGTGISAVTTTTQPRPSPSPSPLVEVASVLDHDQNQDRARDQDHEQTPERQRQIIPKPKDTDP